MASADGLLLVPLCFYFVLCKSILLNFMCILVICCDSKGMVRQIHSVFYKQSFISNLA
jgi:hypothetical protein